MRRRGSRRSNAHQGVPFDHGSPILMPQAGPVVGVLLLAVPLLSMAWPLQTHALLLDLPPPYDPVYRLSEFAEPPVIEHVEVTEQDAILWNGEPINQADLVHRLQETTTRPVAPIIAFEPAPKAGYDLVLNVYAILKGTGAANNRFCLMGLERHRRFELDTSQAPRDAGHEEAICLQAADWGPFESY